MSVDPVACVCARLFATLPSSLEVAGDTTDSSGGSSPQATDVREKDAAGGVLGSIASALSPTSLTIGKQRLSRGHGSLTRSAAAAAFSSASDWIVERTPSSASGGELRRMRSMRVGSVLAGMSTPNAPQRNSCTSPAVMEAEAALGSDELSAQPLTQAQLQAAQAAALAAEGDVSPAAAAAVAKRYPQLAHSGSSQRSRLGPTLPSSTVISFSSQAPFDGAAQALIAESAGAGHGNGNGVSSSSMANGVNKGGVKGLLRWGKNTSGPASSAKPGRAPAAGRIAGPSPRHSFGDGLDSLADSVLQGIRKDGAASSAAGGSKLGSAAAFFVAAAARYGTGEGATPPPPPPL